jgi:hypothetical protein
MSFRKLGHRLGFTRETRVELSDLISESAVVTEKKHIPDDGSLIFLGIPTESYFITFKTDSREITIGNPSAFHQFELNDRVKLNYMDRYLASYDYIPPNFEEKQLIVREHEGHKLVSVYTDSVLRHLPERAGCSFNFTGC